MRKSRLPEEQIVPDQGAPAGTQDLCRRVVIGAQTL